MYVILGLGSGPNQVKVYNFMDIVGSCEYFVQYCNLAFIYDGLEVLIKYIRVYIMDVNQPTCDTQCFITQKTIINLE